MLIDPNEERYLLIKVSNGDQIAFRKIYDAYFDRLSSYVFKFNKSEEMTAEIVQDVFLKLWLSRNLLGNINSLQAYIFTAARNLSIDHLRKLARETQLVELLDEHLKIAQDDIDQQLGLAELRSIIDKAMEELSDQKKQIFKLSKLDGLSHDEIADLMQLSKSTVKNHLSETLKHLREHLRQNPDYDYLLLLALFKFLH